MNKKAGKEPLVFIGSSTESLEVAYAVQSNLDDVADVRVWKHGVFGLSTNVVQDLLGTLDNIDFGILVFAPEDTITIRGRRQRAVRDNVLFELGMFTGRLGLKRTFMVHPDDVKFRWPSDLNGLTTATYKSDRPELESALGKACFRIRKSVREIGPRSESKRVPLGDLGNLDREIERVASKADLTVSIDDSDEIATKTIEVERKRISLRDIPKTSRLRPLR